MRWNARAVREVGGGRWVAGRQASPGAPWNGARAEADGPAAASSPVEAGSVADAEGLLDSAAGAGPAADAAADADADALEHLGDEIATLSAHIHAATHRLLVLIAEFDRRRGWERAGYANCARWLAARTGIDPGAAREKVRAARALEALPETSRAMARGELSFSQVRALTRVADGENERELLELARGTSTAALERVVRAWKQGGRRDEAEREQERWRARTFSVFPDEDGMYVVRGRVTAEVGALLMRAVEAASDALYRERELEPGAAVEAAVRESGVTAADASGGEARSGCCEEHAVEQHRLRHSTRDTEREAARRRADALALLAERALAAGFGAAAAPEPGAAGEPEGDSPRPPAPLSGTRAERYQVVLHVDAPTLVAEAAEPGRSELADGTRVSAETARRIACDAALVRLVHAPDGSVLDVGRRRRTIPPALRRALEARDRGCRFPGCQLRFTDAHHVRHWADGGGTGLANCLLLCRHHHRLVHEGGWRVEWWGEGRPVFVSPRGEAHFEGRWKAPALAAEPVRALIEENRRRGVEPDAQMLGARWERERDIPDRIYFAALEAL